MAFPHPRIIGSADGDLFDSLLEKTDGRDMFQNAWLTIELKVELNFVDSTNPLPGRTVQWDSGWYAKDADQWMFPILDWNADSRNRFIRSFQEVSESFWNYRFLLLTPKNYTEFDFSDRSGIWMVRPNVICLFRLRLVGNQGTTAPTQTISGNVTPHRTINVFRLKSANGVIHRTTIPKTDTNKSFTKKIDDLGPFTFRSDEFNYDNFDRLSPGGHVFGHEIGHALGESHIKCMGTNPLDICRSDINADETYGIVDRANDAQNVMGRGVKFTTINAQPWLRRIARHTYNLSFSPTMTVGTPPRSLSIRDWLNGKRDF